jgi:hypothetical protein
LQVPLWLLPSSLFIVDLRLGQGSVFQGAIGDGKGRIKVFALTGSDVALQLT